MARYQLLPTGLEAKLKWSKLLQGPFAHYCNHSKHTTYSTSYTSVTLFVFYFHRIWISSPNQHQYSCSRYTNRLDALWQSPAQRSLTPCSRSASVASYRFPVYLRGPCAQAAAVECAEKSHLASPGSARVRGEHLTHHKASPHPPPPFCSFITDTAYPSYRLTFCLLDGR